MKRGNQIRSANGADSFDNGPLGITALTNTSGTTHYTRDPHGNLLDERGPTGTFYYLTDRQNSVLALISSTGTDAGDYTYDPYGKLTNAGSLTSTAAANPFRYTSGYQDTEGDNYYHLGARYYDPTIARFTQPDSVTGSIANPRTINPYTYTGDDPLNATDPSGQSFLGDALQGVSSALAVGASFAPGGLGVGLGVAAAGFDVAGGIANGASVGEIVAGAAVDIATGAAGPLGEAAGAEGGSLDLLNVTSASAGIAYGLGTTYGN